MKPRRIILPLVVFSGLSFLIVRDWLKPIVPPGYDGYVEAEDIYISAPETAKLLERPVRRGDAVKTGDRLFKLDVIAAEAALAQARAALLAAEARSADAKKGARQAEMDGWRAREAAAEAEVTLAEIRLKRAVALAQSRVGTPAAEDEARAALKSARSQLDDVRASIRLAGAGQRDDQQAALDAAAAEARAAVEAARHRLDLLRGVAPTAGTIVETYYDVGETVPAGGAIVALRPPVALKIRFFIPQSAVPDMKTGRKLKIGCDGCTAPLTAKVSFVNDKVEYTPPVIYSQGQRDRLVMMVEATPDDPAAFAAAGFRPAQPIRITP